MSTNPCDWCGTIPCPYEETINAAPVDPPNPCAHWTDPADMPWCGPHEDDEPEPEPEDLSTCPACGTCAEPMGTLGRMLHYSCPACGLWWHLQVPRAEVVA